MILTKTLLEQYANAIREIESINRKIEYYSHAVAKSEHGVVQGSMKDYPFAQKHFVLSGSDIKSDVQRQEKLKQLLIDLSSKKEEYERIILDIGIALETVDDSEMSTILFMKYVEGKSDIVIGTELGYERSTITKKIQRFFNEQNLVSH